MLIDPFGRPVNNLRISLTQKCNLNCFYCHHEGEGCGSDLRKKDEMAPEEVAFLVKVAMKLGVRSVKLTGGEPLLYDGIEEVIRRISSINGIHDISMTTNGVLLSKWAQPLAEAGLKRVNVSLDTLSREKYKRITGVDALEKVIEGVDAALEAGLRPVKLNMVLLRGINVSDLEEMIEFSRKRKGSILQLIELVPGDSRTLEEHRFDPIFIEKMLEDMAARVVVRKMHRRKKFFLNGGGEVEVVRPVHNSEFCANCNRMRITSDGKLKPCLMRNDNLVDVLTPIRQGASEEEIKRLFIEAVNRRSPYYR